MYVPRGSSTCAIQPPVFGSCTGLEMVLTGFWGTKTDPKPASTRSVARDRIRWRMFSHLSSLFGAFVALGRRPLGTGFAPSSSSNTYTDFVAMLFSAGLDLT